MRPRPRACWAAWVRSLAARGHHAQTMPRRGEEHAPLLDPDHQGIMAGERLNARGAEAGLPHPGRTLGTGKIKPATLNL